MTLADIAFVATISTALATGLFDWSAYSEINSYFEKLKAEIPNYEKACGEGAVLFGSMVNGQ